MKDSMKTRLIFCPLLLPAIAVALGCAGYYHVMCDEFRSLPKLISALFLSMWVIEALLWFNSAIIVLCFCLFLCRRDGYPFCCAFQMFLTFIAVALTSWSFYNDSERYENRTQFIEFMRFDNWTDPEALFMDQINATLADEAETMTRRRIYDYEYFKFYDKFQKEHKCCGVSDAGYYDYFEEDIQAWLHDDLRNACIKANSSNKAPIFCYPLLKDLQELPESCCNPDGTVPVYNCSRDVFNAMYDNGSVWNMTCGPLMQKLYIKCIPIHMPISAITFLITVYTVTVTYAHARKIQNTSFWTKFCCYCFWTVTVEAPAVEEVH